MPPRMTTKQLLARLARLSGTIERAESRLEGLYAQRLELYRAGREKDPATGSPRATFPAMAAAARVSEVAVYKALRREDAGRGLRGRHSTTAAAAESTSAG